jgi:hypothetical protein
MFFNSVKRGSATNDDEALVRALQAGEEQVFNDLVERWSGMMLRLALAHVDSMRLPRRSCRTRG